jgi:hypothetical protein
MFNSDPLIETIAVRITIETMLAISAYSIAVAPR